MTSWNTTLGGAGECDDTPGGLRAGTFIMTERGGCPVETLKVGDRVLTAFSTERQVRWVGRRGYMSRFVAGGRAVLPVLVRAGALGNGKPERDLYLAPGHALYIRTSLVPVGLLINGSSILQTEVDDPLMYVHIGLDACDLLLANGVLAESYVDHGRSSIFHHVDGEGIAADGVTYRRLTAGSELEAIRLKVASRVREVEQRQAGELIGHLDTADAWQVRGWAWQAEYPDEPVLLEVLVDRVVAGMVLANLSRPDVRDSGLGSGKCGFAFRLPRSLSACVPHAVEVRRVSDGAGLAGSPRIVIPQGTMPPEGRSGVIRRGEPGK